MLKGTLSIGEIVYVTFEQKFAKVIDLIIEERESPHGSRSVTEFIDRVKVQYENNKTQTISVDYIKTRRSFLFELEDARKTVEKMEKMINEMDLARL